MALVFSSRRKTSRFSQRVSTLVGPAVVGAVLLFTVLATSQPASGEQPTSPDPPPSSPAVTASADSLTAALNLDGTEAAFFGGLVDTIFVEASPIGAPGFASGPAILTVVPLAQHAAAGDLAELLSQTAGLQVRRYGGLGAPSTPTIRGSSGAQVVVMLDGMPLADAQDGTIDLANLPLERFAAAEVYRGLVPAGFGGAGGAGAVNLISQPAITSGADVRLFAGSFGDHGGRLLQDWVSSDGRRSLHALVHGRSIDNDFGYRDHNQTFYNADDDSNRTRRNAAFDEWGGYLDGRLENDRVRFGAALGTFRKEGGRPGPLAYESPHASVRYELVDGRLTVAHPHDRWRCDLLASRRQEYLFDPLGEVSGLGTTGGTTHGVSEDLHGRLSWSPAREFGTTATGWPRGRATLRLGGSARRQWFRQRFEAATEPLRVRSGLSAFSGVQVELYGPRVTLHPAVRWEMSEDHFPPVPDLPWLPEPPAEYHRYDAFSPSFAAIWEAVAGRFFIESHLSRAMRQPTWVELFGHRGGIAGNRELRPETVRSGDLGLRLLFRQFNVRAAAFVHRTDDAIVFLQNSQRTSKAENLGRTRSRGLEFEANGVLPGGAVWSTNLTWQQAVDRSVLYDGKDIPLLPPLEVFARLEVPVGPWRGAASVIHEAANYRDRYNHEIDQAPARTLLNLSLARSLRGFGGPQRSLTVTGGIINLTDNDVYDVEGFPLPGRSLRLSIRWR